MGGGPREQLHSDAMQLRTTSERKGGVGWVAGQIGEFAFEITYEPVTWHNRRSLCLLHTRIASPKLLKLHHTEAKPVDVNPDRSRCSSGHD